MKKIAGFIIACSVTLILVELFVSNSYVLQRYINDYNQDLGRIRRASTEFVMFNEGFTVNRINSFGYVGKEYGMEKDSSTFRVAVLGDSYVESFQVFDRNYFGRVIENEISEQLGMKIEVLNFGRSGFDLGDCYAYYHTFVNDFEPDLSIIILGESDYEIKNYDPLLPKVVLDNGKLDVSRNYIGSSSEKRIQKIQPFLKHSIILNTVNICTKIMNREYLLSKSLDKLYIPKAPPISKNAEVKTIVLDEKEKRILDELDNINCIFVLRDRVNFTECSVAQHPLYEKLEQAPFDTKHWDITNKYGHWNNDAHILVGEYLSSIIIREIQTTHYNFLDISQISKSASN